MIKRDFDFILKQLMSLSEEVIDLNKSGFCLTDYPDFDLSEVVYDITEESSLKEVEKLLEEIKKVIKKQKNIADDMHEKIKKFKCLDDSVIGYPKILNYGNFYIIKINVAEKWRKQQDDFKDLTSFYCVYDKEGNLLIPFNEKHNNIQSLDENNFIIKLNGINKVDHYKLNDNKCEKVFTADYNYKDKYSFNKCMSSWENKGLAIILINDREYLYSIRDAKVLSYGFTKIESIQDNNWEKTNFTKEFDCCRAILDIETDVEFDCENPSVATTLVGYINSDGKLINNFINLENGDIILTPPGKENETEEVIKKDLDKQVINNLNIKDRIFKNNEKMIKSLNL